jgi:hypothetical protein
MLDEACYEAAASVISMSQFTYNFELANKSTTYLLTRVRQCLHTSLDGIDGEHYKMFPHPSNGSRDHVLQHGEIKTLIHCFSTHFERQTHPVEC